MVEYIKKVKLNYDFYKGCDEYSDGDIENEMLDIAKNVNNQADIDNLIRNDNRWPILYHFSNMRHNILNWYSFDKDSCILEIGAGCGAVTGLFCEKLKDVTAVDLSKRRSMINAYRNSNYDNLEIIVGNFEDISFDKKYDYISLIGVLEYSIYYIDSDDPFNDMLKKVKDLLKPDGKLIIAIENKYGLKYWLGAPEDHTGRIYDGIEGYIHSDKVRTFSKNKLDIMLKKAGFKQNDFYYPMPDYKMPSSIFSDVNPPREGEINYVSPSYDRNRIVLMSEQDIWNSICQDGLFDLFANSFLVISYLNSDDKKTYKCTLDKPDFIKKYEKEYNLIDLNDYQCKINELECIIKDKDAHINNQDIYIKKIKKAIKNPLYGFGLFLKKCKNKAKK